MSAALDLVARRSVSFLLAAALAWTAPVGAQEAPAATTVALALPQAPVAAPVVAAAVPEQVVWLKMKLDEKVAFSGKLNDAAGPVNELGNNMTYPAANALTLLVAIATHGVLANSSLEKKKKEQNLLADKVLLPYRPVLDEFSHAELAKAWATQSSETGKANVFAAGSAPAQGDIVVESQPHYLLTQDQRAIIVDNVISITPSGGAEPYRTVIRVVSDDIGEQAPQQAWIDASGRRLKDESVRLLAASMKLALQAMREPGRQEGPQKTLRYREGGKENIARGQLLAEDCGRIYFKSLRDEMISAPKAVGSCTENK